MTKQAADRGAGERGRAVRATSLRLLSCAVVRAIPVAIVDWHATNMGRRSRQPRKNHA
jgi:hypothetical protein